MGYYKNIDIARIERADRRRKIIVNCIGFTVCGIGALVASSIMYIVTVILFSI